MSHTIVFLDAGTLDYGDISFSALSKQGKLKLYHHTKPEQVLSRVSQAAIVITNKCRFDGKLFKRLPKLKMLCIAATGTNNVDLEAARHYGIAVTNVAGYSTEAVVQWTFAFILALAGDMPELLRKAKDGAWRRSAFFNYAPCRAIEINGKVLGILGYGTIGRRVASVAKSFGMKVLVGKIPAKSYKAGNVSRVSFQTLVRQSDFLTLHTPLTPLTRDLINAKVLRTMKKGSCLINMARGGIVNEKALAKVLRSGHLRGAATDVLSQEPPEHGNPLLSSPRMLITPHIAWASREARSRLVEEMAENIRAFKAGRRRNRVD